MARRRPNLTKYQQRLLGLLTNIEDSDFRDMLIEVISIESRHRSAGRFPVNQIRDAVDNLARLKEDKR